MSDPAGTKFNGSFNLPVQQGPTRPAPDTRRRTVLFEQTFWQRSTFFKRAPLSLKGPSGSWMIKESEPRDLKHGSIVEWIRTFAQVPPTRIEYEQVVHNYQWILNGAELLEIASTVTAEVTYSYFHIPSGNPEDVIPISHALRLVKIGDDVRGIGDAPGAVPIGTALPRFLHEDEHFERWKESNIYEKVSKKVPQFSETIR